jgi:hypothetical protein
VLAHELCMGAAELQRLSGASVALKVREAFRVALDVLAERARSARQPDDAARLAKAPSLRRGMAFKAWTAAACVPKSYVVVDAAMCGDFRVLV